MVKSSQFRLISCSNALLATSSTSWLQMLIPSSMSIPLRCLCPCLRPPTQFICRATSSTYLSFYHTVRSYSTEQAPVTPRIRGVDSDLSEKQYLPEPYPRITPQKSAIDFQTFQERYKDLVRGESRSDEIVVRGMSCFGLRSF